MRLSTLGFAMLGTAAALGHFAAPAAAQSTSSVSAEANSVADGWAALVKGDLTRAQAAARTALTEAPRSVSALALIVEIEIAGRGAMAGLDAYERWLAGRAVEAPYVVSRIASAVLQAAVRQRNSGPARVEALKALVANGDPVAIATLTKAAEVEGADPMFLAAFGQERAVQTLITNLQSGTGKIRTVRALADSGSTLAVPPLLDLLASGSDDERAAAAEALSRLGAQEAVAPLTRLLEHANFTVRFAAAGALSRLGDYGGVPLLDQLLSSEHAAIRLSAAEALSVLPGRGWLEVARGLTLEADQSIRLGAARLLAPYDRELAESVLFELGQSGNLAIREEAVRAFAERVASTFTALRVLLRNPDGVTAVRAATRLLELTR